MLQSHVARMPRAVLLDGGMGHQLRTMGVKVEGPRGSMERFLGVAMANSKQPELVTAAHLSYIDAGADVITTNNYAVKPYTQNSKLGLEWSTASWPQPRTGTFSGVGSRVWGRRANPNKP